jgi:hypothetical protein
VIFFPNTPSHPSRKKGTGGGKWSTKKQVETSLGPRIAPSGEPRSD